MSRAPEGSAPATWPEMVAGSPPKSTLTPTTAWPFPTVTVVALSGVSAVAYQTWVKPAPLNRIL